RQARRGRQEGREYRADDGDRRLGSAHSVRRLRRSPVSMTISLRAAAAVGTAAVIAAGAIGAGFTGGPSRAVGALAGRDGDGWITWWRQDAAPTRWEGNATLADRVVWRPGVDGVEWGELLLHGRSEAWRTRLVLVRMDPRRIALSLAPAFLEDQGWTVGDA